MSRMKIKIIVWLIEWCLNACKNNDSANRTFPGLSPHFVLDFLKTGTENGDRRKFAYKHEPVGEGDCSTCHDPHGSDFTSILLAMYPPRFYSEFKEENYELCFQCHDASLVETKETSEATNFRDGTRNLHYVHVDLKKGRTCRACHEVHAGKNKKLVREHVPFGKWSLPLNFKKTTTGGSCTPGCHKPYTYNREIKTSPKNKWKKKVPGEY